MAFTCLIGFGVPAFAGCSPARREILATWMARSSFFRPFGPDEGLQRLKKGQLPVVSAHLLGQLQKAPAAAAPGLAVGFAAVLAGVAEVAGEGQGGPPAEAVRPVPAGPGSGPGPSFAAWPEDC